MTLVRFTSCGKRRHQRGADHCGYADRRQFSRNHAGKQPIRLPFRELHFAITATAESTGDLSPKSVSMRIVLVIFPGCSPAMNVTGMTWTFFGSVSPDVSNWNALPSQVTETMRKGLLPWTTRGLVTRLPGSTTPMKSELGTSIPACTKPYTGMGTWGPLGSFVTRIR